MSTSSYPQSLLGTSSRTSTLEEGFNKQPKGCTESAQRTIYTSANRPPGSEAGVKHASGHGTQPLHYPGRYTGLRMEDLEKNGTLVPREARGLDVQTSPGIGVCPSKSYSMPAPAGTVNPRDICPADYEAVQSWIMTLKKLDAEG
ncbi:hypothetical protein CVT24_007225 [Panaeolus cyanescens]|uniref:Uncharacterized protein n=1 Tax=Panaeolus cyanescens TaxID=181874 RepID=A0A409VJK1_9AGAR|nr:hypothetical protein CVT24_007225 [Panaeolus cyanescens]